MTSAIIKHSLVIARHKTSVSLEDEFWCGLKEIAEKHHTTVSNVVGAIKAQGRQSNLSSAIRLHVLDYYRAQSPWQNDPGQMALS